MKRTAIALGMAFILTGCGNSPTMTQAEAADAIREASGLSFIESATDEEIAGLLEDACEFLADNDGDAVAAYEDATEGIPPYQARTAGDFLYFGSLSTCPEFQSDRLAEVTLNG